MRQGPLFDFGSRPLYTRSSKVRSARRLIWPTFRAIQTPPQRRGTRMAHSEGAIQVICGKLYK